MHKTIKTDARKMNSTLMPSTPMPYVMPHDGIHSRVSTNCRALEVLSKFR